MSKLEMVREILVTVLVLIPLLLGFLSLPFVVLASFGHPYLGLFLTPYWIVGLFGSLR